jgi:hypothetical protein
MASGDLDPHAPIVDEATFTLAAELEVRQAIRLQYYVSMLALQADPHDAQRHRDVTAFQRLIAEVIRDQIRSTDVVAVMPTPPHLRVLLVSSSLENLPAIIGRIAAAVNGRTFNTENGAFRVTLSMGGACFPTTARSRPELSRQAEVLSIEARASPGRPGHRYRLAQAVS